MSLHEDPELDEMEKVTRFGCGALLGIFVGFGVVIKLTLSSFGLSAAVIVGAILLCGCLALKYGDDFWIEIIKSMRWW